MKHKVHTQGTHTRCLIDSSAACKSIIECNSSKHTSLSRVDPGLPSPPPGPRALLWPQYLAGNSEQLGSRLNEFDGGLASCQGTTGGTLRDTGAESVGYIEVTSGGTLRDTGAESVG